MRQFTNSEILEVYQGHPLSAETIIARLRKQRGTLKGITELDLAEDDTTGITDQNHIGGLDSVKQLASASGITAESRVLDVGAGLGGSSRVLAYLFGCRVHGIELSEQRCEDARQLTQLVGLEDLVYVEYGDFLTIEPPSQEFDVVWGQSAWVHIEDKEKLVARGVSALADGGRLAFEDSYLKRAPRKSEEQEALDALSYYWRAHIVSEEYWTNLIEQEFLTVQTAQDLTEQLVESCVHPLRLHESGKVVFPEVEVQGWSLGKRLAETGLLGYMRMVAVKHARADS
jgi:protein-L-isoaspartate O-methyltransferase